MHRPILIATTATLLGLMAGGGFASAHYWADPASNFSAYYYQSPGGISSARSVSGSGYSARGSSVPYAESCGSGRVRKDGRCVRE
jgi:hypothetical protein